jgi:hypothetical protein
MSALNIGATTTHRAFKLPIQRGYIPPYSPLSSKKLEEMRQTFKSVVFVVIDEVFLVAYKS